MAHSVTPGSDGKDAHIKEGRHMDLQERYFPRGAFDPFAALRDIAVGIVLLIVFTICWPFYSVPTGSRGVITQFGKIVGIEGEGLAILPPWQKLSNFSIRAETANIENAEGSTSDTQPVKVSLTVRYSIATDRVAEVFEKYSHDGNLSSYVQTATQEIF